MLPSVKKIQNSHLDCFLLPSVKKHSQHDIVHWRKTLSDIKNRKNSNSLEYGVPYGEKLRMHSLWISHYGGDHTHPGHCHLHPVRRISFCAMVISFYMICITYFDMYMSFRVRSCTYLVRHTSFYDVCMS